MNIYNLSNVLIVLYAIILFRKGTTEKNKLIFIILCFTQLFLISYFRDNIGYDYNMYSIGFFEIGRSPFSDLSYYDWEWGFRLFTKLMYVLFPNDVHLYFAVCSLIVLLPIAYYIYKYSSAVWLSTLCYVNLYFFYMSMNFLRQALAVSISLLCWRYIKDKKPLKFLIIAFIAMSFHYTAFILIPVYLIIKMPANLKTFVVYCFLLMFVFISSDGILKLITEFYHSEYKDTVFLQQGISYEYEIVNIVFLILTLICSKMLLKQNKENKLYINLMYFSSFWTITMLKHSILERFSYYTYIVVAIVLIPNIYVVLRNYLYSIKMSNIPFSQKNKENIKKLKLYPLLKSKMFLKLTLVSFFITLLFFNNYIGIVEPTNNNGKYVYGVHGILPYRMWN